MGLCVACNDPDDTGLGVLPPEDYIHANYVDTFTVHAGTIVVDSVFTFNPNFSLIGEYFDDQFGRINAKTFTQFHISGDNLQFGEDTAALSLDSIVLTLDIEGFYGRLQDPMVFHVHEVTQAFPTDSAYSDDSLMVSPVDLAGGRVVNFAQIGNRLNTTNTVRIPLAASLGNRILKAPTDSLINNAVFRQYFKGLRISAEPIGFFSREPGGVYGFDLLSSNTGLILYYKDSTEVKNFGFDIDDDTPYFHSITRLDESGKLLDVVAADSLNLSPTNLMVQSGAFVKMWLQVPYLTNIAQVGVNFAELEIKVDESYLGGDERFDPPSRLYLYLADSTGRQETSISVSNADYDPSSASYHIPLSSNVMAHINGQRKNYGFILVPGNTNITVNRAVIGGPSHPSLAPRLKVVFTTLPG